MKNGKLFWLGIVMLALLFSSMACQDLFPQKKATPAPAAGSELSTGRQNPTNYYRFYQQ
jgi:hypothetical protein